MTKRFTFFFAIFLLAGANLFSAGIETTGVGARATAMGGQYRAVADDWSAMYWNPAGLAGTQGWNAGFHAALVMPRAAFQAGAGHYYNTHGGSNFERFSAMYESERTSEPQNFVVPAMGVSYQTGRWAFGLGVWAPMGWGAKWDVLRTSSQIDQSPGAHPDGYNDAYPVYEYESDIQVIDIHPTLAFKFNDKFSIGVGASLVLGEIAIRQPAFLQNPYLYDQTLYRTLQYYSDENALVTLDQMRKPPFDHLITEAEIKSSGTTWGGNVGFMYKPSETWSFGASIQYYADLKATGDYSQTTYFGDAPAYHAQTQAYSDSLFTKLHNAGLIDDQQYQILTEFYSGNVEPLVDTKGTATVPLPLKVGLGLSYSGFKNLLLVADVNYTQWSVWDVIGITDANGAHLSQLVQNWNDTFKIGCGFEYTAGAVLIRGGFGAEKRAAPNESVSPTIPDIGDRYNVSCGLAVPLGPVFIAINYEHIFIPDNEIKTWVYDEMTVAQNVAGAYSMRANSLMIGIDYRF